MVFHEIMMDHKTIWVGWIHRFESSWIFIQLILLAITVDFLQILWVKLLLGMAMLNSLKINLRLIFVFY